MIVCRTIADIRRRLNEARSANWRERGEPITVGLVPTMGYLHDGHASLLKRAREECDIVVLSIFVNPIQFGPNEDFDRYPRDEERDLRIAEANGVDFVLLPSVEEMYPAPARNSLTIVRVSGVSESLCGASRPGHFDGVATVVSKLFHIVSPERAYFGMKDAQQVAVIRQMVRDLNFPVEIVACPTLREPDGLALSSRNVYLNPEERAQAVVLSQALSRIDGWLAEGVGAFELRNRLADEIRRAPLADIDYVEVRRYPTLEPADDELAEGEYIAALAVRFGRTRLIDNRVFHVRKGEPACSAP